MMEAPSNRLNVVAPCIIICYPCANVVMYYDGVRVQNMCGDVCHVLLLITSSKLSKSWLAKCGIESLLYVYMLARYAVH